MRRRPITFLAAVTSLLALTAAPALAATDDLVLLSAGAPGAARQPALSADGGFAAFVWSRATDGRDLVRREVAAPAAVRLSGSDSETPAAPSISASGRYVAFETNANLAGGRAGTDDVYVRDVVSGTTTLVSRANGASGAAADADSNTPAISADGRFVAFRSEGDNLSGADDNGVVNVYLRDLSLGTTLLVSRASGPAPGANGTSIEPAIAPGGRYVAFRSFATDLAPGVTGSAVYLRDTAAGTTTLVSRASGANGAVASGDAASPSVSADGRFVAFDSTAGNLGAGGAAAADVYVRDLVAGTTSLVSRATGASGEPGDGTSEEPSISADGRLVAFTSEATNLSGADDDDAADVFVRDVRSSRLVWASRGSGATGPAGPEDSSDPALSGDGRFVAFASESVLAPGGRASGGIYRRELGEVLGSGGGDAGGGDGDGSPGSGDGPGGDGGPGGGSGGEGGTEGGGGSGTAADGVSLSLRARKRQRLGSVLTVSVQCFRTPCRTTTGATVATRARQQNPRRIRAQRRSLRRNQKVVLRLRTTAYQRRVWRRALRRGAPVTATVVASATDTAGNRIVKRVAIRLVRR